MAEYKFDRNEFSEFEPQDDMKEYINKLVAELREDKEVYEIVKSLNLTIGEVKDNIARLTDFKNDYNYCQACPGLDKCGKDTPHTCIKIKKEGRYLESSIEPCQVLIKQIAIDRKYLVADFPNEWKSSTVKSLDLSATRKSAIKEFAAIISQTSERWIYVMGNHKTGKSFLLVTFANEFASLGRGQVAVVSTPALINSLSELSNIDKEQFNKDFKAVCDVPLLVFDNFGEEYKNEYIRDTIVLPLLSYRESNSLLTFFASSYSIDEIKKLYSVGKTAGEIRGNELGKILTTMCGKEFNLTGASIYRK